MNREIKFRGKSISTGKWIYAQIHGFGMDLFPVVVYADTISQYTGLYDKKGKEIYEGDILASEGKVIGWVQGGVRGYCYDVVYIDHPQREKRWSLYGTVVNDYPGKLEVIGNIYDNRELLEK